MAGAAEADISSRAARHGRPGARRGRPAGAAGGLMAGERSLFKSIGSNWAVTIMTIVMTFVLTPFIIHRLGTEAYGTWALITSITGYLGLLVLGVPMASVRYFSEYVAGDGPRRPNEGAASCTGLYVSMVGIALCLTGRVFEFFAPS